MRFRCASFCFEGSCEAQADEPAKNPFAHLPAGWIAVELQPADSDYGHRYEFCSQACLAAAVAHPWWAEKLRGEVR